MYHFQFADMFYFLGLDNLGKDQECHYYDESTTLRKNHCFVRKHHNKILTQRHAEGVELIPSAWAKYSIGDVDKNTRKNQVMSIFETWMNWEVRTKDFYTEMYHKLQDQNAIVDACRVHEMILDVEDELARIHECVNKLKMHDYALEVMLNL